MVDGLEHVEDWMKVNVGTRELRPEDRTRHGVFGAPGERENSVRRDMGRVGRTENDDVAAKGRRARAATIRVMIVDDHVLFADVIQRTLEADGWGVVAAVATGADALTVFRTERPNLVLIDLALPDRSGLSVGQAILEQAPNTVVIALTGLDDPQLVKQVLRAGFRGYVTKDCPVSQLREAITQAVDGQVVVAVPTRRGGDRSKSSKKEGVSLLVGQLTPRERQVLALLAQGASSLDMARHLGISPNTLRTHVQSVLTKLQVHSRLEAASFAVRNELVPDGELRPGSFVRRSQGTSMAG
jgi:DNA-binding NarL/FixJ family response regulator